jgi:DNA segregation ATPase FtsK/SpoIIIE, S-DNA-T family
MPGKDSESKKPYVDRPPRIQPILPQEVVPIPKPPSEQGAGFSFRQLLLPLIMVGGYVLISFTGQGRNLLFILPMGLSVIAASVFTYLNFRAEKKAIREKRAEYRRMLSEMRQDMVSAHDMQRDFYYYNFPNQDLLLHIDGKRADSRGGTRLWERRTFDDDFLELRLGIGARPSEVIYEAERGDDEQDELMREAIRLDEDSRTVFDIPITIPLYQRSSDPADSGQVRHAIGISGKEEHVYAFVKALINQIITLSAPTDVNLHVVSVNRAERQWMWLKNQKQYLPHIAFPKVKEDRRYFPLCFEDHEGRNTEDPEKDKVSNFWKLMRSELDRRQSRIRDDSEARRDISIPFLLTIVDMLEPISSNHPSGWLSHSALSDVEAEAAVATLLKNGAMLGSAIFFLVPERRKVPSGCTAVIEIEQVNAATGRIDFRYAEIGVNTPRFVGRADVIEKMNQLDKHIRDINQWELRRSYGEGIPDALSTMELFRVDDIESLRLDERWQSSVHAQKGNDQFPRAEWLKATIGIMSNAQIRSLRFAADGDGVHGMIAGSTGSGKSELLMTLILALCIEYDPSIVNFVLIDYKGGAAFDPFKTLPHKVDIVTNLQGAAVDRMFKAINAELNRRQAINTVTNSKHIVHYRERGLHLMDDEEFLVEFGREKEPYPHLFIIIDEFAEMISNNSEYKAQLNSITRLGRALGVSLILAAQRPTGVTDQMRANIKFRISLRVETREESSEMLRRPDAAYLPTGIPGRGYLQVGNENIELIQVGWTGGDYENYVSNSTRRSGQGMDWDRFKDRNVIWLDRLNVEPEEPPKLFEVMVDAMETMQRGKPPQFKPWPSPLPNYLSLSSEVPEQANYLDTDDQWYLQEETEKYIPASNGAPLRVSPAMWAWQVHLADQKRLDATEDLAAEDQATEVNLWPPINWEKGAMQPIVGLVDDPSQAEQHLLRLNFRQGHVALFGASGWGKTTLIRSAVMSLAVTHSPENLHIYVLDFGGRQLEVLRSLPHVGSVIRADEAERINRLLRVLDSEIENRKELMSRAQANNVYSYNSTATNPLPSILVVVDNFAEIRENYEELLPSFISLAREGLSSGVHFLVTAEQTPSLGKLYNLFTERLALKLADTSEYGLIVGRIPGMEDIAGRGYMAVGRTPLQFQISIPVGLSEIDRKENRDETRVLASFIDEVNRAWSRKPDKVTNALPQPIINLPAYISLDTYAVEDLPDELQHVPHAIVGLLDADLTIGRIKFDNPPHFIIAGSQQTGKTTALRTLILSLAYNTSPEQVGMVFIDPLGLLYRHRGDDTLADLPHVLATICEPNEFKAFIKHLNYEYNLPLDEMKPREIFIFIDNYDYISELKMTKNELSTFTRSQFPRPEIHFVISGSPIGMKTSDELIRRTSRAGLAMDVAATEQPFNIRLPRSVRESELPLGRGFLISSGRGSIVQVAMFQQSSLTGDEDVEGDATIDEALERWSKRIIEKYAGDEVATWIEMETSGDDSGQNGRAPEIVNPTDIAKDLTDSDIERLYKIVSEHTGIKVKTLTITAKDPVSLVNMAMHHKLLDDFLKSLND